MSQITPLQGTLLEVLPTAQRSETFSNRIFILKYNDGKYDQEIPFELHNDNCDIIEEYAEGEEIKVHYNLRGKKFDKPGSEPRWFIALLAWRIERV